MLFAVSKSFQLVVQWSISAIEDYDALIELEDRLMESLPSDHSVDGHDAGSGEFNIFVITGEPVQAFGPLQQIVADMGLSMGLRAGYRALGETQFIPLWPTQLTSFRVI